MLDKQIYLDAIEREGAAMADAAIDHLDAPVRSCPGWDVRALVGHTGTVHRVWRQVVDRRLQSPADIDRSLVDLPPGRDVIEWFREGVTLLVETLGDAEDSQPIWTWSHVKNVSFVPRRMAQETAVHRWDAQSAGGAPRNIESELAADGIDEMLDIHLPSNDLENLKGNGETIHLHRSDGDGEWLIRLTPEGAQVERGHAKGNVAARGTASDLLLMLWGRIEPNRLELFGDASLLDRYLDAVDLN